MRDRQRQRRLRRVVAAALGRPLDVDPVAAEDEQVEVDLARSPALPRLAAECPLEALERDEQRERAILGHPAARHVERGDGVPELGLVDDADRLGGVQARHAAEPGARERRERMDRGRQRPVGVADVRPQADVRPDPTHVHAPPAR